MKDNDTTLEHTVWLTLMSYRSGRSASPRTVAYWQDVLKDVERYGLSQASRDHVAEIIVLASLRSQ